MKAEEARRIADNTKVGEMEGVLKAIATKAVNGEYNVYFYHNLNDKTIKSLKELGFKYESLFSRNEILITISW